MCLCADPVIAERWGSKAWSGSSSDGMCLISTDANTQNSIAIGFSDGRMALNDYAFAPIMRVTISNVAEKALLKTREIVKIKISFDDGITVNTLARASHTHGDLDLYFLSVSRGRVADQFDPDTLNYSSLTSSMQRHSSMQLKNRSGETVLDFSLMGFSASFKKFQDCVNKLQ